MSSIILHISDLHVSLDHKYDGQPNEHDSYLSAGTNDNSSLYLEKFIEFVKLEIKKDIVYLLITGDVTDWGEQKEFSYAELYLKTIIDTLNIERDNILLIPGDHDLNRRSLENLFALNENNKIEEQNKAKFQNFVTFYSNLLGKKFDPNLVIFDSLIIENKLQLLGVNSSFEIDLSNKLGAIPIEQFESEFNAHFHSNNYKKIFCCHHNIASCHENKKSGQWNLSNRARLISKLQEKDINFVFSGNEHTSSLEKIGHGEITISDSGPLSSTKHDSAFKIYEINDGEDIILSNKIYALQKTGAFENPYHWEQRNNSHCRQDEILNVFIKDSPKIKDEITELIADSESAISDKSVLPSQENSLQKENTYYNSKFTDLLYEKVKKMKIFHTGHFHWSETSRAHNWIDVSKLIEDKDNLNFLKDAIIDVLDTKIGSTSIDLIIGLGYEGNILATKSAIKYNKPYCFLPYSYRYHEHNKFENKLNFDNVAKKYNNILIVTDVVNEGRTIRKLIKKRQEQFFTNVEKIYVISLFYTGDLIINNNILNFDFLKSDTGHNLDGDEEVSKIEFYAVKSLKVEKCPYGKNFRDECFIYKDDLSCVNLFYDEKKYLSQK